MSSRPVFHRYSSILIISVLLIGLAGCSKGGGDTIFPPNISFRGLKDLQYNSTIPLNLWVESKDALYVTMALSFKDGSDGTYTPMSPLAGYFDPTSLGQLMIPSGGTEFIYWWHAAADLELGKNHGEVYLKALITLKDGTIVEAVFGPIQFDYSNSLAGAIPPYVPGGALPDSRCSLEYGVQLPVQGGYAPFEWTLLPPGSNLPYFLELTHDGRVRGTFPDEYGPNTITFVATAMDSNPVLRRSSAGEFTIFVDCETGPGCADPPEILFSSIPEATVGAAYFHQCTADAGEGALTWGITEGQLPTGLTFNGAGLISGTPSDGTAGIYDLTIQVCDSCPDGPQCDTVAIQLNVNAKGTECDPGPSITTQTLPSATEGAAYNKALTAADGHGELSWEITDGDLPAGISLTQAGILIGTPAADTGGETGNTYNFIVQVCDSCPLGEQCDTREFSLLVGPPIGPCGAGPVLTTTSPLPSAAIGIGYNFQFAASGGEGALSYTLNNPDVLTSTGLIWTAGGVLSGTPLAGSTGFYNLDITVRDACWIAPQSDNGIFELSITDACADPPAITTMEIPLAAEGSVFDFQFAADFGQGALTWSKISGPDLPAGLILETTGQLHGTPQAGSAGPYNGLEILVQDSCWIEVQTDSNLFNMTVTEPCGDPPDITTYDIPPAAEGHEYNFTLSVVGGEGSLVWSILPDGDQLPADLVFSDGTISGIPQAGTSETYEIQFQVCDSCPAPQCNTETFDLVVSIPCADPPEITTTEMDHGIAGEPYEFQFEATGGEGNLSWLVESMLTLPPGFALSNEGLMTGNPTSGNVGDWNITVILRDSCWLGLQEDIKPFTLVIEEGGCAPPPQVISMAAYTLPAGAGSDFRFFASGGEGTLTWIITDSTPPLPGTIQLLPDGALVGTTDMSEFGTYLLDISVCDECPDPGIQCGEMLDFELILDESSGCSGSPPEIQDLTIPTPVTDGSQYSHTMSATGGDGGVLWFAQGLPPGLFIDFSSGEIMGSVNPEDAGTYLVVIWVLDHCMPVPQADSKEYSWNIL